MFSFMISESILREVLDFLSCEILFGIPIVFK